METISDSLRSKADIAEDLEKLKSWLSMQPHLPHDIEEELLTAFVYGTSSLQKAKKKLDAYLTFRGKAREIYNLPIRDPSNPAFLKSCQSMKMFTLPKLTKEGLNVLCALPHQDFSQFQHRMFDMRLMITIEMGLMDRPDMKGQIFIMDLSSYDSSFLVKFSPSYAAATIHLLQDALPVRPKKIIYFNAPNFIDRIFNMVKPLLSKKTSDRVIITSKGAEVLKEYLPIDILPKEYGGEEESAEVLNDRCLKMLVERREWYVKSSSQCSDESKRPVDRLSQFGVEGNFKYLQID